VKKELNHSANASFGSPIGSKKAAWGQTQILPTKNTIRQLAVGDFF